MVDSLRDLLLKSGIVQQVQQEKRAKTLPNERERDRRTAAQGARPLRKNQPQRYSGAGKTKQGGNQCAGNQCARSQQEIDLAKAYALRAQTEADERKRAEHAAAEEARQKRERKAKIQRLLSGQALNLAEADHVRHFEYGGKIRRIHVDAAQLKAINTGELGIVQQAGRYLLVNRAIAEQVRAIDTHLLALLIEPGVAGTGEDDVPDDLIW